MKNDRFIAAGEVHIMDSGVAQWSVRHVISSTSIQLGDFRVYVIESFVIESKKFQYFPYLKTVPMPSSLVV